MRRLYILVLALCLVSSSCFAMEITEQELKRLEINLTKLEQINQQSQRESAKLKTQVKTLQTQADTLSNQLKQLKQESRTQEILLQNANESLAKYEKEMKQKVYRLKAQRNIAYAVLGVLLIKGVRD